MDKDTILKILKNEPICENGTWYHVIGDMFDLFKEDKIVEEMQNLNQMLVEFDFTLCSFPAQPNILCAKYQGHDSR